MFRRTLLSLLPAVLALTFLVGTPDASAGSTGASAAASSQEFGRLPAIRGSLTEDIPDGAFTLRADEDDTPDDRIFRTVATTDWPEVGAGVALSHSTNDIAPTHRPCAAPPRAPPIV